MRVLSILIVSLGLLVSGQAFGQAVPRVSHRDRANELLAAGKVPDSISEYRKALVAAEPDSAAIHNELGVALAVSGNADAAVKEFRIAISESAGNFGLAHYNLGVAFMQAGDLKSAESEFKTAIEQRKKKGFPEGHNTLGILYTSIDDTAAAVAEFRKAIDESSGPYPLAQCNLGIALLQGGDAAASIVEFKAAIAQSKTYPDAYYNLGVALEDLRRNEEAAQAFEKYLSESINPSDVEMVRKRICRLRAADNKEVPD